MTRAIFVSRQRLIGATNGSSSYLLDIARSLRAAGLEPVLLQPSPDVMGRIPFYRARPEMAVFAEHDMLGHLRQMMPRALADLVIREVPKNLLHLSVQDLAEAVERDLKEPDAP